MSPLKTLSLVSGLLLVSTAGAQTIATVDGTDINSELLERYVMARTGQPMTDENRQDMIEALADMITLAKQAEDAGLDKSADVVAELKVQRLSILANARVRSFLQANQVTEADAKAEYDAQIGNFNAEQQYKARHILVEEESTAKEIIKSLEGGADFAELAKEKSTGPSGPQGGDLGWFSPNTMVAPFSAAVVALKDGEYTKQPVQTDFGWHVILREESRQATPPSFDEVKPQVIQSMEQAKVQGLLQDVRAKSTLKIVE